MKLSEDRRKLLKVVTLYYEESYTQAEIGKMMGISRPVISKMLQVARDKGIVEIFIKDESSEMIQLGLDIQKKYQLDDVIVLSEYDFFSPEDRKKRISQVAASYLESQLDSVHSIGVSWGTTLANVIDEMPYTSYSNIVVRPLVGGVASEHVYYDTNHLAFRLAEKISASCSYFYAPALAESKELAKVLKESEMIVKAMEVARKVDIALIGVGNPICHSTWKKLGYLNPDESLETTIVGDAVASLFDKNGKTVNNKITERMLGLTVEELTEIKKVIVVAAENEKAESIRGLLQGNRVNVLIISEGIAESLLRMDE